jgi:hypothetical protein
MIVPITLKMNLSDWSIEIDCCTDQVNKEIPSLYLANWYVCNYRGVLTN